VTRSRFKASVSITPSLSSVRGSDFANPSAKRQRTARAAIAYCSTTSVIKAVTPSTSATSRFSNMVARVEPSATVTTRSNALIFAKVRLPLNRNIAISAI